MKEFESFIKQRLKMSKGTKYPFKEDIDQLLDRMPMRKIKKARVLFEKWCVGTVESEHVIEQVYRGFGSSFKVKYSYTRFKAASLLLLYLYGSISEKEIDALKESFLISGEIATTFEKHRDDLEKIKEVDDALRKQKFWGRIPMDVSCLAIGASISFVTAVKSILDIVKKLHTNKEYRKKLYAGGHLYWDEAILLLAFHYGIICEKEKLGNKKIRKGKQKSKKLNK